MRDLNESKIIENVETTEEPVNDIGMIADIYLPIIGGGLVTILSWIMFYKLGYRAGSNKTYEDYKNAINEISKGMMRIR